MKVYPVGYSSYGSFASVESLMQQPNMLLIDTRKKPYSWRADWKKEALQKRYGARYRLAGEYLGNLNYQGGPIKIANPEKGIAGLIRYLDEGHDLILLCECAEYNTCHRKVIIDMLLKALPDVEIVQPGTTVEPDQVMCLSVRQPYATWLSNPAQFVKYDIPPKTIENREWNTHYRGPLLIHASATFEDDAIDRWSWEYGKIIHAFPVDENEYVRKAIIGIADLVNVVTESRDPWFCGTYGFVLANARSLEPIPYRGQLKLFPLEKSLVAEQLMVKG